MPQTQQQEVLSTAQAEKLNAIIKEHKNQPGGLMSVLHETQELLGYIPYQAQATISEGDRKSTRLNSSH